MFFSISKAMAVAFAAVATAAPNNDPLVSSLSKRSVPLAIPQCAPHYDTVYQPVMDFDKDSCYNQVAVGADRSLNTGMSTCACNECGCRDRFHLESHNNVYSRSRCNHGWCAFVYDYYFPKDKSIDAGCSGHRHDWEHVVVWVKDLPEVGPQKPSFVAVSQHGGWLRRPRLSVLFHDGWHPKIVCELAK